MGGVGDAAAGEALRERSRKTRSAKKVPVALWIRCKSLVSASEPSGAASPLLPWVLVVTLL